MSDSKGGDDNLGAEKPRPPPKATAVKVQALPSKPKGIKGWGRVRVGVGVPVKKAEDSEGMVSASRLWMRFVGRS